MFLGGSLELETRILYSSFTLAAKRSWLLLLFATPDIAVGTRCSGLGEVYMQAHVPFDDADAQEWGAKTLSIDYGRQSKPMEYMKEKCLLRSSGSRPASTFMHMHASLDDTNRVKRINFMLNMEHQITDGVGIRILLTKYLSILATQLIEPTDLLAFNLDWEESSKFLTPAWIFQLNEKQTLSGPQYEEALAWNRVVLLEKMVRASSASYMPLSISE